MPRRILQGTVVSDKGDKTVIVSVERRVMHPIYKKFIRRSKRYAAHDPLNAQKVGDVVQIRECKPISRTKTWEVFTAEPAAVSGGEGGGVTGTIVSGVAAAASGVSSAASSVVAGLSAVVSAGVAAVTGSGSDSSPKTGA
jgi:small subunit ribosomal protein S17